MTKQTGFISLLPFSFFRFVDGQRGLTVLSMDQAEEKARAAAEIRLALAGRMPIIAPRAGGSPSGRTLFYAKRA
ncbi:MAG: hypothetical protein MI755_10300 [Sphingomonadales bacterium]|nr:hypothetical protein [Sphingomonadales bacterium]